MDQQIANTHNSAVCLIREIITFLGNNKITTSKASLVTIVAQHPETREYLDYIQKTLLVDCRDNDILTIDGQNNYVRFPKKRNMLGNIVEYYYIT